MAHMTKHLVQPISHLAHPDNMQLQIITIWLMRVEKLEIRTPN
jgi:hypothetical protein